MANVDAEDGFQSFTDFHSGQEVGTFLRTGDPTYKLKVLLPPCVGKVPTVAYPGKPFRKDMKQEPSDKFFP